MLLAGFPVLAAYWMTLCVDPLGPGAVAAVGNRGAAATGAPPRGPATTTLAGGRGGAVATTGDVTGEPGAALAAVAVAVAALTPVDITTGVLQ